MGHKATNCKGIDLKLKCSDPRFNKYILTKCLHRFTAQHLHQNNKCKVEYNVVLGVQEFIIK